MTRGSGTVERMSGQTVILATGAALVGVVAGFFAMLHFAGTANAPRKPQREARR